VTSRALKALPRVHLIGGLLPAADEYAYLTGGRSPSPPSLSRLGRPRPIHGHQSAEWRFGGGHDGFRPAPIPPVTEGRRPQRRLLRVPIKVMVTLWIPAGAPPVSVPTTL